MWPGSYLEGTPLFLNHSTTSPTMRIRLRGPDGASTIILGAEATVCDLRAQISEKTGLSKFDIKYSYPPKPLHLDSEHTLLSALDTRLDGEQLTISAQDGVSNTDRGTGSTASANDGHISKAASVTTPSKRVLEHRAPSSPSFSGLPSSHKHETTKSDQNPGGLVNLQRKKMAIDAPELPLPDRQATLGTMPLKSRANMKLIIV
jgi:ubiquitin thioesterase OTU1